MKEKRANHHSATSVFLWLLLVLAVDIKTVVGATTSDSQCGDRNEEPVELSTLVLVDAIGNPYRLDVFEYSVLRDTFIDVYNSLLDQDSNVCDPLHRYVESVDIQLYRVALLSRRRRFRRQRPRSQTPMTFLFRVHFKCLSHQDRCLRRSNLFAQGTSILEGGGGTTQTNNNRRQLSMNKTTTTRRNLSSDESVWTKRCDCSRRAEAANDDSDDSPTFRAPRPREFLREYRSRIQAVANELVGSLAIQTISNVLEVRQIPDCTLQGSEQTTALDPTVFGVRLALLFEQVIGTTTQAELDILENVVLSSYNFFSNVQCDGRFTEFLHVSIAPTSITPLQEMVSGITQEDIQLEEDQEEDDAFFPILTITASLPRVEEDISRGLGSFRTDAAGSCRGCEGVSTTANDGFRRRTRLSSFFLRHDAPSFKLNRHHPNDERKLAVMGTAALDSFHTGDNILADVDPSDSCFCASQNVKNDNNGDVSFLDALRVSLETEKLDGNLPSLLNLEDIRVGDIANVETGT